MLRKFQPSDVPACFANWGCEESLGKYLPMYPFQTPDAMSEMIQGFLRAYENDAYIWVIVERESGEPIGTASVDVPHPQLQIGELAYLLGPRWAGKGYAYEATSAIVSFLLQSEGFYLIEAKYNETNVASEKLLRKLGFQEDGRLRGRRIDRDSGERDSLVVCSLLKGEWVV